MSASPVYPARSVPSAVLSDAALLARFLDKKDQEAFEQLVERYGRLVLNVCRSLLGRHHDAEDAAQATFVVLARRAGDLRHHAALGGWLHTVAWHVATRARAARDLRARRERAAAYDVSRARPPSMPAEPSPISAELHRAIVELPEKYRIPFVLHHLQGWTEQQTAEALGSRLGTVSGQLSRARAMVRDTLERRGHLAAMPTAPAALAALAGGEPLPEQFADHVTRAIIEGAASEAVADLARAASQFGADLTRSRRPWLPLLLSTGLATLLAAGVAWWALAASVRGIAPANPDALLAQVLAGDPDRAAQCALLFVRVERADTARPARQAQVYVYGDPDDAAARRNMLATLQTDADGLAYAAELPKRPKFYVLAAVPFDGDPVDAPPHVARVACTAPYEAQVIAYRSR